MKTLKAFGAPLGILAALIIACVFLGSLPEPSRANNGDVTFIQRTGTANTQTPVVVSGSANPSGMLGFVNGTIGITNTASQGFTLPAPNLSGSGSVTGTLTGPMVPQLTATATILNPVQGELGLSASNTPVMFTGTTWILVP